MQVQQQQQQQQQQLLLLLLLRLLNVQDLVIGCAAKYISNYNSKLQQVQKQQQQVDTSFTF